jgi:hypothetical protein
MTKTFTQAAAFALAVLATTLTCAGANAMAAQQHAKAYVAATANMPVLTAQTVIVVGHRA